MNIAVIAFWGCAKLVKIDHFQKKGRAILASRGMKIYFQSASLGVPLLICVGFLQMAGAQIADITPPAVLSTEEVVNNLVRRNLERSKALSAFRGTRTYRLDYHGFPGARAAEMVVEVTYKAPGAKDFSVRSETGSRLIIERVFKRMLQSEKEANTEENQRGVALNQENYRFTMVGQEENASGWAYVLSVEPKTQNKLLYRGRIWVDAKDFAVTRIEGEPAKNPSFWTKETQIEQVYTKVGDFWLPHSNRSSTTVRLGGHALFTIDYGDYQITAASQAGQTNGNLAGYR